MSWKLETSPQLKVGKIIVGYLLDENTDRVELSEGEEHKQAVIQPCCKGLLSSSFRNQPGQSNT